MFCAIRRAGHGQLENNPGLLNATVTVLIVSVEWLMLVTPLKVPPGERCWPIAGRVGNDVGSARLLLQPERGRLECRD